MSELKNLSKLLIPGLLALTLFFTEGATFGALPPLSEDDALLVLMGSAPASRKAELIRARGIESKWGGDFLTRLSALCLDDDIRAALEQEFRRTANNPQAGLGSTPGAGPDSPAAPGNSTIPLPPSGPEPGRVSIRVEVCGYKRPPAPDERLVARIVERLTNNDARLQNLLKSYTFHTSILARKMDPTGAVLGSYYGEWDVMFSDRGERMSHEIAKSPDTTNQGVHLLKSSKMEPGEALMFLPQDRDEYAFRCVDHVALDEIGAYKLSVEPKEVEAGKVYFKGTIWVEDRSLQIVKADGDRVPSFEHGFFGWRFYPHYVTFRSQTGGRFWLPTLTVSDGMADGVRVNSVIKYFEYRRFGSESVLTPVPDDDDSQQ